MYRSLSSMFPCRQTGHIRWIMYDLGKGHISYRQLRQIPKVTEQDYVHRLPVPPPVSCGDAIGGASGDGRKVQFKNICLYAALNALSGHFGTGIPQLQNMAYSSVRVIPELPWIQDGIYSGAALMVGTSNLLSLPVSYTHLTLPTICSV